MANDTLLGQTETQDSYDGSGVFNPSGTPPESSKVVLSESSNDSGNGNGNGEGGEEETGNKNLLMYAGAALLLYFFVFKKK
jgi:hypothetical protein